MIRKSPSSTLRIGYACLSRSLAAPGDRRRFVAYARARGLNFEIAEPGRPYDIVVLSELADVTYWANHPRAKIVYDLVDSYLAPGSDARDTLRGTFKFFSGKHRKLEFDFRESVKKMCRRADAVVCTTEEQRADIRPFCANAHIVLDVHGATARARKSDYSSGPIFKIAWEGLSSNVTQLATIAGVIKELGERHKIEMHIVTDPVMPRYFNKLGHIDTIDVARKLFGNVTVHPWLEDTCAKIITGCDLAVIPIDLSDPFSTGKPENKLVLLWKMGMPVVTSATPAYVRTMQAAGRDDVCCDDREWRVRLERMIESEELRRDAATKGCHHANAVYSDTHLLELWDAVFASCGFDFAPKDGAVQA